MELIDAFLAIFLFVAVCGCLLAGFPVAFTLAGVSLIFALLGAVLGVFDLAILLAWPSRIFGTMTNATLFAVPLFILMGLILERSKVAQDLLTTLADLFGRRAGGLALAVTLVSTLLAASTGIVGATVVTMGLLALPVMLARGYDPALSTGTIASAGTLGVLIPPSILLVLLGDILASAYAQAQMDMGNYMPDTVSVGDLFAGALFPGLMLAGLYMAYQMTRVYFNPALAPPPTEEISDSKTWIDFLRILIAPILLIVAVLGSILAGAATPTEAAAIGALGACLIAAERHEQGKRIVWIALGLIALLAMAKITRDVNIQQDGITPLSAAMILISVLLAICVAWTFYVLWRWGIMSPALRGTAQMTAMVFAILICAGMFSLVFRGLGGDVLVRDVLTSLPGGKWTAFALVMLMMFFLGFVLDFIEITFVVVPIVAPILMALGFDPVWLGVMIALNLQTSFLTPPFGFALFYLRGVAPPSVKTFMIYRGIIPFVGLQILALALVGLFPQIATWLPEALFD